MLSDCRMYQAPITLLLMLYLTSDKILTASPMGPFCCNSSFAAHPGSLIADARYFMQQGVAKSTCGSYQAGLKCYLTFCAMGHRPPFPASEEQMMDLSAFIAQSASFATIKVYVAGIRLEHIERRFSHPFDDSPSFKLVLRGICGKGAYTRQFRLLITVDVLHSLKRSLCDVSVMSCYDICLMWSVCTLTFFGFLHCTRVCNDWLETFLGH